MAGIECCISNIQDIEVFSKESGNVAFGLVVITLQRMLEPSRTPRLQRASRFIPPMSAVPCGCCSSLPSYASPCSVKPSLAPPSGTETICSLSSRLVPLLPRRARYSGGRNISHRRENDHPSPVVPRTRGGPRLQIACARSDKSALGVPGRARDRRDYGPSHGCGRPERPGTGYQPRSRASARDTQADLSLRAQAIWRRGAATRYGAQLDSGGHFRVYGNISTARIPSARRQQRTRRLGKGQMVSVPTGVERRRFYAAREMHTMGKLEQQAARHCRHWRNDLLARWSRAFADGSSIRLQGYTTKPKTRHFPDSLEKTSISWMSKCSIRSGHWGHMRWSGARDYRYANDSVRRKAARVHPADRTCIGQTCLCRTDRIRDNLHLTLGRRRSEHTALHRVRVSSPSARIAWKPAPERLIWSAVSRAVRAPSRIDRDFLFVSTAPAPPFQIAGGPDFRSEVSNTFELGYRAQPTSVISYSVTAFHSIHDHIRSVEQAPGGFVIGNGIEGHTSGIEAWGSYQATRAWRLSGGVVLLRQRLELKPDSTSLQGVSGEGNDPKHRWMLRSLYELTEEARARHHRAPRR